ncbi:MAG: EamA/RhaT family transporter [Sphingobacteriaceae bacterium]|nr:MAG: EamA/RhaT family transporter [Sphingobacteriaceae bacterium]
MNPKLSLAFGIICISFSPIFVKLADASPIVCGFYRLFFAFVFLAPYCLYKGNLKMDRKDILLSCLGGLIFASDIALWNQSLKLISATVSTLLANLAPIWVGLISYFILRKKSGRLFWIGTCVAIAGMVVLVGINNLVELQLNIGMLYALIASMLYAIYMLVTKDVLKRIDTIPFMFYSMLASCIFLVLLCLLLGNDLSGFNLKTWGSLIGMGLICQLIGWITINHAIHRLESTTISITLLSQTVVSGILAALILNETLDVQEIVGSFIVLCGIAVTFLKPKPINI